jgi:hypothetical protein
MADQLLEEESLIVGDLRAQLGDVEVSVTRKWREDHEFEVLHAYRAWIAHQESLGSMGGKRFTLIPMMQRKRHFVTVRPLPLLHLRWRGMLLRPFTRTPSARVLIRSRKCAASSTEG